MASCKKGVCTLILLLSAGMSHAAPPTAVQIDTARNKALAWLLTHQSGEGGWKNQPGAEIITTSSVLEALEKTGVKGPAYSRGTGWLSNAKTASTDSLSRKAISMYKAGMDTASLMTSLIAMRNGSRSWGAYARYGGTFPDTSLVMDAIRITGATYADTGFGLGFIASRQNADGGWPYNKTAISSPPSEIIPTAHNIITLNRYKTNYAVQTNITNGINWLKPRQKASGGFGEGTNGTVYETALAYLALSAELGTADVAAGNALGFIVSQQQADGSWGGEPLLTGLALQTLPTPSPALADTDGDGIPDAVESLAGTNPLVADADRLISGNGSGVSGLTVAKVIGAEAVLNSAFSHTLTATGGTAPYSWKMISGSLPPGLALSTAGLISGTPSSTGVFNFTYQATDASNPPLVKSETGQISVFTSRPTLATGDVTSDGIVDVRDVLLTERFALGLATPTAAQKAAADVAPAGNPDGVINAADVARIRLKALGVKGF
ncbi:MAG: putative Ig domain-containing protein [Gammaproteobacteria bacterium]|nr:putative Ig domain-containing protein [Gammaproteobacteria bacterium]